MDIHFRSCSKTDLAVIERHVMSLYQEIPAEVEIIDSSNIHNTYQEFTLRPEKGSIIVFELDGSVVGYAILVYFWSNEYGGDVVEIDELFIHADYRNCGIGAAFFQWLTESFRERAVAFTLQVSPDNVRAVKFYDRIGFSIPKSLHYLKLFKPKA